MMVLVAGCTRIWALSGTCLMHTTLCMAFTPDTSSSDAMVGGAPITPCKKAGRRRKNFVNASGDEAVADAGFRQQVRRLGGVGLQLLAQAGDVDAQVVAVLGVARPPHLAHQVLVRHHLAGVGH